MRPMSATLAFAFLSLVLPAMAGQAEIESAKRAVREQMKDPESARFKSVFERAVRDTHAVCGQFNGKNAFGGYVGYRRFVVWTTRPFKDPLVSLEGVDEPAAFEVFWKIKCLHGGASFGPG